MASPFTSSTPAMYDYVGGVKQLQQYADYDPYLEAFMTMQNRQSALNEQMMKNQIASSTAETARLRQEEEQGQRAYTAGLQTAGVQSGASRYLPEYQAGLVEDARRTYVDRFQKINDAEKLAIAKAQQAKQEGDVALLKEQLDLLKMLRTEKADALERAQDLEWEKEKFKQQMSLQWAQENRLGKGQNIENLDYTDTQLLKLRAAGIDPTNTKLADNFLFNEGLAPSAYTKEYMLDNFGKNKVWKLALAMGIPRVKNQTRENEINALFNNQEFITYIQEMLAAGNTIDDIIKSQS